MSRTSKCCVITCLDPTIFNWGRRYEIQIWCNQFSCKGASVSVVCNNKDVTNYGFAISLTFFENFSNLPARNVNKNCSNVKKWYLDSMSRDFDLSSPYIWTFSFVDNNCRNVTWGFRLTQNETHCCTKRRSYSYMCNCGWCDKMHV